MKSALHKERAQLDAALLYVRLITESMCCATIGFFNIKGVIMFNKAAKFLLPLLALSLPLSASAVNSSVTVHVGKMNQNDIWVVNAYNNTSFVGDVFGRANDHEDSLVFDSDLTRITFCVGSKRQCMTGKNEVNCQMTDLSQGNGGNSKIDVTLEPEANLCKAVKYSV